MFEASYFSDIVAVVCLDFRKFDSDSEAKKKKCDKTSKVAVFKNVNSNACLLSTTSHCRQQMESTKGP